jgi:transcriptional regulator with XRE-family HTH domain
MWNPKVCRLGRAYLNWNQATLAERAGMSLNTVRSFESGESINQSNVTAIQRALEGAGLIFRANGIDSADAVLERFNALTNPTREQTSEAIIAAGVVRRAGGRRAMPTGKAAEILEAARLRRSSEE